MGNISIAFCFNDRYSVIAAGAVSSLIKNTTIKYNYDIYIITDDISDHNRYRLNKINNKENVKIKFIDVDISDYFTGELVTCGRLSKDTYTRLFLHKILPFLEKVLYLDGDLIITSDIADLYNTDLSNYSVAAALDVDATQGPEILSSRKIPDSFPEQVKKYKNRYDYYTQYLGFTLKDIKGYFNAGVLLLNLKRAAMILDKAPNLLKRRYINNDQCILNLLFKDDKLILEQRYNVWPSLLPIYVKENGTLPDIIHFWAGSKPINSMTRNFASEYWVPISHTDFYYPAIERFVDKKITDMASILDKRQISFEERISNNFKNEKDLTDLLYNLRRINKKRIRRKYIRLIIKFFVDSKRYRKLKRDPIRFFKDSKSKFIKFLGRYYN